MPKFVFKLEAVLNQRLHVERQRQRDVAGKQRALTELQEDLRAVQDRVRAATEELRTGHLVGTLDLSFLAAHRRFMLASHRKGMAIVQKIAAAQKSVDEARISLQEAVTQRKVLDKLRGRQLDRWNAEQHRRELSQQDEINVRLAFDALGADSAKRMEQA